MNKMLADYTTRVLNRLGSEALRTQEEIPEYIQEVLKWLKIESVLIVITFLVFGTISGVVLIFCIKKGITRAKKDGDSWFDCGGWIVGIALSGIILVVSLIVIPCQISTIVQIQMAPRLFLLEYFNVVL